MANIGNVYVFNSYNETISKLLVDDNEAGSIPGWSKGDDKKQEDDNKYVPRSVEVPRSKYPDGSNPTFYYGSNKLDIHWVSYNGDTTIEISEDVSLLDDLIVYLTLDKAILMNTRGKVLKITDIKTELFSEQSAD